MEQHRLSGRSFDDSLSVVEHVKQINDCAAALQRKHASTLPPSFLNNVAGCIAGFLERSISCIVTLPNSIAVALHQAEGSNGGAEPSSVALYQSTMLELAHLAGMELLLPASWWVVEGPRRNSPEPNPRPMLHKQRTEAVLRRYFNARLEKCMKWINARDSCQRKWFIPCPIPPSFSDAEKQLVTRLASDVGLRGHFAMHSSMFEEQQQQQEPPRKRQREEEAVSEQRVPKQHNSKLKQPPPYTVAIRTAPPSSSPVSADAAAHHLWRRFMQSWNWQRCVLESHDGNGPFVSMRDIIAGLMTSKERAVCSVHPVGDGRTSTAVIVCKDLLRRCLGSDASSDDCVRMDVRDQLVAVSPSQHLYVASSGVCADSMATFRQRDEDAGDPGEAEGRRHATGKKRTPSTNAPPADPPLAPKSCLMPPGWSHRWAPVFGCYVLQDHIRREAFLDAVYGSRSHNAVAARMASTAGGPAARPHCDEATAAPASTAPSIADTAPLLRKVLQYSTIAERNALIASASTDGDAHQDGGAMGDDGPCGTASSPSAFYRQVSQALERRLTAPRSAFDPQTQRQPDNACQHTPDDTAVDLPLGQIEEDGWVVDHVQRIAIDGNVPLCVSPWTTCTLSCAANPATEATDEAVTVAVVVDPQGLNWSARLGSQALAVPRARIASSASAEGAPHLSVAHQEGQVVLPTTVAAEMARWGTSDAMHGEEGRRIGVGSHRTDRSRATGSTDRLGDGVLGRSTACWTIDALQQQYQHVMCAAHGDFDIGLRLGSSAIDSAFYNRWRHVRGRAMDLIVIGAVLDSNCMGLVVASMRLVPCEAYDGHPPTDASDATEATESEIAPYSVVPVAFNGSLAACDVWYDPVGQELGHWVADWLAGSAAWADVVSYCQAQFLGTYHGVVLPFTEALHLRGRIELR